MLEGIYFFIIGAFIGWILECVFKFATKNFKRTPGILNTPFCILYGLGTVALSLVIGRITNNFLLAFILSMIVLSIMEYITFVLLKKIYNVELWDYNNMKFNICNYNTIYVYACQLLFDIYIYKNYNFTRCIKINTSIWGQYTI